MIELIALFLNNLLPIFLIGSAGYFLARWLKVDPKPVSQIIFYVFSPCLVFVLLTENKLEDSAVVTMMAFAAVVMLLVGLLTFGAGKLLRLDRSMLSAVLITVVFMNAGNYGLPVNRFAFGDEALAYASLYFVTMAILTNSVGVIIASMGTTSLLQSILGLLRLPTLYALLLGLLFSRLDWTMPLPLDRSVNLLADAAIPSMLVLLGLQFYQIQWNGLGKALVLATGMRLLLAPALALGVSLVFGLQGPARQAGILESGMPTAVMATILATQYDVEPSFVTTVVITTTLLSPFTLTPLLAFLSG